MARYLNTGALALLAVACTTLGQDASVRPGRGVGFKGENVSLGLGGRIQVRHTYDAEKELSDFSIPRIRLALKGSVFSNWKWEFQSDFAKKEGTTLKDGLLEYAFGEGFNLRGGQTKVRFDRQQLESSGRQTFVDRAIASRSLGMGRDIGLLAHGRAIDRKLHYSAGLFNGGGEGGVNRSNRGHLLVGRLSINPLGDFGLAQGDIKKSDDHRIFLDAAVAQQPDSGEVVSGTTRYVMGAGYRFAGIYLAAEYYGRMNSDASRSDGLYAQLGYTIVADLLELAGRFSMVDPNKDVDNNLRTEIMGGLNVFFNKLGHGLKLTGDVAMLKDEAKGDDSHLRTRLQAQMVF